jgi:hypothetical protein
MGPLYLVAVSAASTSSTPFRFAGRRSYLERQVVGRVASPDLGGEREAIPSTYATFALHVTTVSYALLSEGAPVELPVWATGFFR